MMLRRRRALSVAVTVFLVGVSILSALRRTLKVLTLLSVLVSLGRPMLSIHVLLVLLLSDFRGNPARHHHHGRVRAAGAGWAWNKGASRGRHESRAGRVLAYQR